MQGQLTAPLGNHRGHHPNYKYSLRKKFGKNVEWLCFISFSQSKPCDDPGYISMKE